MRHLCRKITSMRHNKLLNDPIYGLIDLPSGLIFNLIEHRYFQRLRRIKQLGLTDYVYPGALHTRFHHALGAMHLMKMAVGVLRQKGIAINAQEEEGVKIAILLHDIGHGPFSHALEQKILPFHHEALSMLIMEQLNKEFDGQLTLAIKIFKGEYERIFLHELISGQLDMDRMDYLKRDSFFTGVHEGVIGHERIISMLNVSDNHLVVEEKGIYSIEKFLVARRLMYWQVYLHKTVLNAEQMLIRTVKRAKELLTQDPEKYPCTGLLGTFLENQDIDAYNDKQKMIENFTQLDDYDVVYNLKIWQKSEDKILSLLAGSIMSRRLFRIEMSNEIIDDERKAEIGTKLKKKFGNKIDTNYLIISGSEHNTAYSTSKQEIKMLLKTGEIKPLSEISDDVIKEQIITKYYLCYPKDLE